MGQKDDAKAKSARRRAYVARAKKITAARIVLAKLIEREFLGSPRFIEQLRDRGFRTLEEDEHALFKWRMDELTHWVQIDGDAKAANE